MNVVRTAFDAYETRHWAEFAATVHPDALADFYKERLDMAQMIVAHSAELNQSQRQSGASGDFGSLALMQFAGVKTLKELRALSPQESLARYLEAMSPHADSRDPDYQPPKKKREIVGEVTESPDLVHVVYRMHTNLGRYGGNESIEVISVKRAGARWQIMLNNELTLTGFMSAMTTSATQE